MTPSTQKQKRAPGGSRYLALVIAGGLAALAFTALSASFFSYRLVLGKIVGAGHDDQLLRGGTPYPATSAAYSKGSVIARPGSCLPRC